MRDRVALGCLGLACLVSGAAAVFNLVSGDYGEFWWFVVILCMASVLLALQLRHVRRRRFRPGSRP